MGKNWTQSGGNVFPGTIIEADRVYDVRDAKWAHPELEDGWVSGSSSAALADPSATLEEKRARADKVISDIFAAMGVTEWDDDAHSCTRKKYIVPGCPEEPDTEVEVYVYRPKTLKSKRAKCMFLVLASALLLVEPDMYPIDYYCETYKCVAVVVKYRPSYKAPYPGALNDCHAGYQWMLSHAEEIQINPDNVVIFGVSSGGHLGLSLGFRLKRYGFDAPKGIVTYMPQTDDRETDSLSSRVYTGIWDSVDQHNGLLQYAGVQNAASSRLGPEFAANRATVEDCIGYPPTYIITVEFDPDRENSMHFYNKLFEAKTFAHFSVWPGAHHMSSQVFGTSLPGEPNDYGRVIKAVLDKAVNDCFTYDLRRPWVVEEARTGKNV